MQKIFSYSCYQKTINDSIFTELFIILKIEVEVEAYKLQATRELVLKSRKSLPRPCGLKEI